MESSVVGLDYDLILIGFYLSDCCDVISDSICVVVVVLLDDVFVDRDGLCMFVLVCLIFVDVGDILKGIL